MAQLKRSDSGLNYDDSGAGSPVFLFLKPMPAPATLWSAQVSDLAPQYRCIVVEVESGAGHVDAVSELLGELQPGPVIIVGPDDAAETALFFNERYPEAVTGIALVNPALPPAEEAADVGRAESLVRLADKKPFMVIWPETPAGNPAWLRDVTMFVRQEPVAGTQGSPPAEQPDVTNALLKALVDDIRNDPRLA